jgi:hypothetical protein
MLSRPLLLALAATLGLSAWALWWPRPDDAVTQPNAKPTLTSVNRPGVPATNDSSATPPSASLPVKTEAILAPPVVIEPALRDPFAIQSAPAQPPSPVPQMAELPSSAPEPPPPAAPAPVPELPRYLGQFQAPGGERVVLLTEGAAAYKAAPGVNLPSGWIVTAVDSEWVRLQTPDGRDGPAVAVPRVQEDVLPAR